MIQLTWLILFFYFKKIEGELVTIKPNNSEMKKELPGIH